VDTLKKKWGEPRGSARSLNDMTSRENRTDTEMASEVSETSSDSVKKSEADAEASTPPKEEGAMRLFVGGVTPKSTFDSLIEYFQQWGPVKSIELMRDR
jgi:RNA recognition motif-containing protein